MIKKLGYLIILSLFICCKTDDAIPDCSAVLCLESTIIVNLVDDSTKENSILQNNIIKESILIQDTSENLVEFRINETNGLLYIAKPNLKDTVEIQINSELIASISYNTSNKKANECCSFGELIEVAVENKTFELEGNKITIYLQ